MAIRTVFLRFSSNANVFAADMARVASATKAVQAAGTEAAASQRTADAVAAEMSAARSKRLLTQSAVEQQLAELEATRATITEKLAQAEAEANAATTLRTAGMEREAEVAIANQQATLSQAASYGVLAKAQAEQVSKREAELAVLSTTEAEAAAAAATTAVAAETANATLASTVSKQQASQAALMGRVGTFSLLGGAAVGFGLYEAAKAAMAFEGEMQKVAAISVVARNNLGQMSTEVLNLSKELPVSAEEFASALLVAEQAGYHGYQAIALLHTAAEGATIGFSNTADATKDLARVLNGFGLTASDAANVNNILVAAVQNGIGSYHNFGDALAQIGPLAKAANISINDAAGAIAAMSSKGIEASGAGMGLIRMIFNMGKEGSTTEKAFVGLVNSTTKLHVESGAAALSALGLSGTIELLGKQTQGAGGAIEALFPSVRQAKAAFALLSDGGGDAIAMMKLFNDQEALAEKEAQAWAESQKSTANQMKISTNEIKAAGISLGSELLPVLASTANFFAGLITTLADFNNAMGGVPIKVAAAAAGFAIVFGLVSKMVPVMSTLNAMFTANAVTAGAATVAEEGLAIAEGEVAAGEVAIGAAAGPVGWIALAITGAVAALGLWSTGSQEATKRTQDFTAALSEEQSGVAGATATLVQHDLVSSGLTKSFNEVGISVRDVTGAILATGDATKVQTDLTSRFIDVLGVSDEALKKGNYTEKERAQIHDDVAKAVRGDSGAIADMNQVLGRHSIDVAHVNAQHLDLLNSVAKERSSFLGASAAQSEAQKALVDSTKEYNVHLFRTGEQLANVDESLLTLSTHQVEVQKAMQGFIDLGAAMDEATKRTIDNQATFTTGQDIFKDLLKTNQDALNAQAQAQADTYNAALTDSTQAAQDAARASNETVHDTVATVVGATKAGTQAQKELAHDATAANAQTAREISRQNADAKKSSADFKQQAVVDKDAYIYTLAASAQATKDWRSDLDAVAANGGSQAVLDNLRKLGKDGVPLIHEFATASKAEIDNINASFQTLAPTAEASYSEFQKAMLQQMSDEADWENNLKMLAMRGGGDLAEQFIQLAKKQGKKSSGALAEALKLSDDDLRQANQQAIEYGKIGSDGYTQNFESSFTALERAANASGTSSGKAFVESLSQEFGVLGMNDVDVMTFLKRFQKQIEAFSPALARELFGGALGDAPDALSNQENRGTAGGAGIREGKDQGVSPGTGITTTTPTIVLPPTASGTHRNQAFGGFYPFADGTERHIAQFAQGGDWRIWAEPETGGEAYIPLSIAKRGRSMNILNAVASEFGYGLHRKGEQVRPAGAQLTGSPGRSGDTQVMTHMIVKQPVSKTTEYKFTGPIQGYRLEQVTADADRKSRLAALSGSH